MLERLRLMLKREWAMLERQRLMLKREICKQVVELQCV